VKRFYCTICKKVKRVRVLPVDAQRHYEYPPVHKNPKLRTGTCTRHNDVQRRNANGMSFASFAEERRFNALKNSK